MAIVENFWLRNSRKRLAGSVIYNAMGQTRQRALATSVTNPRTEAQQTQRVKWSNLVNLYRPNRDWMKYAFETKQEKQSEYNKFMSLNVSTSRIYLPKQVANAGGCVVDNYLITQGSLPSIEITDVEGILRTNLYLTIGFDMDPNVTVGEISRDLLLNNPALREGDQLSLIIMAQQTNNSTGYPYVVVRKYEVLINSNSLEPFFNYMPRDYIGTDENETNAIITIIGDTLVGGFAMILSRTISGKTYVSTQRIYSVSNDAMINRYSSPAALAEAIESYGDSSDAFLSTTSASEDQQAAISPSIVSAMINDNPVTIGGAVFPCNFDDETTLKVGFNQNMTGTNFSGRVIVYKGTTTHTINPLSVTRGNSSEFQITLPESAEDYAAWALKDIYITIDDTEYRAAFVIPNAATISGLE